MILLKAMCPLFLDFASNFATRPPLSKIQENMNFHEDILYPYLLARKPRTPGTEVLNQDPPSIPLENSNESQSLTHDKLARELK